MAEGSASRSRLWRSRCRIAPAAGTRLERADIVYALEGRITTSEPKGDYPFERSSRLSPVPGLADTWR